MTRRRIAELAETRGRIAGAQAYGMSRPLVAGLRISIVLQVVTTRYLTAFCLALVLLGTELVGAPTAVGGMLYEEYFRPRLSTSSYALYLLKPDGSYVLLSEDVRAKEHVFPLPGTGSVLPRDGSGRTGTYTYQLLGDDDHEPKAVLTLDGEPRTLRFLHDSDEGTFSTFDSFRFFRPSTGGVQKNFSNRVHVTSSRAAIAGFVLEQPQWVLLRVAGPSLLRFDVSDACLTPVLRLFDPRLELNGGQVFELRGWLSSSDDSKGQLEEVFSMVGAFPFPPGSADCAILRHFAPGAYTIHGLAAEGAEAGEVLIEAYYLPFQG